MGCFSHIFPTFAKRSFIHHSRQKKSVFRCPVLPFVQIDAGRRAPPPPKQLSTAARLCSPASAARPRPAPFSLPLPLSAQKRHRSPRKHRRSRHKRSARLKPSANKKSKQLHRKPCGRCARERHRQALARPSACHHTPRQCRQSRCCQCRHADPLFSEHTIQHQHSRQRQQRKFCHAAHKRAPCTLFHIPQRRYRLLHIKNLPCIRLHERMPGEVFLCCFLFPYLISGSKLGFSSFSAFSTGASTVLGSSAFAGSSSFFSSFLTKEDFLPFCAAAASIDSVD